MGRLSILTISFLFALPLFGSNKGARLNMIGALTSYEETLRDRVFGLGDAAGELERSLIQAVSRHGDGDFKNIHLVVPPGGTVASRMLDLLGELFEVVRLDVKRISKEPLLYFQFEADLLGRVLMQKQGERPVRPLIVVFENIDFIEEDRSTEKVREVFDRIERFGEFVTTKGLELAFSERPIVISTSSYSKGLWEHNAELIAEAEPGKRVPIETLLGKPLDFRNPFDPFFREIGRSLDFLGDRWSWDIPSAESVPEVIQRTGMKVINVPFPFGSNGEFSSSPVTSAVNEGVRVALEAINASRGSSPITLNDGLYDLMMQRVMDTLNPDAPKESARMFTQELFEETQLTLKTIDQIVRENLSGQRQDTVFYEVSIKGNSIDIYGRIVPNGYPSRYKRDGRASEAFKYWLFLEMTLDYDVKTGQIALVSKERFSAIDSFKPIMRPMLLPETRFGGPYVESMDRNNPSRGYERIMVAGFEAALFSITRAETGWPDPSMRLTQSVASGLDYEDLRRFLRRAAQGLVLDVEGQLVVKGSDHDKISRLFDFGYIIGKDVVDQARTAHQIPEDLAREIVSLRFNNSNGVLETRVVGVTESGFLEPETRPQVDAADQPKRAESHGIDVRMKFDAGRGRLYSIPTNSNQFQGLACRAFI